MATANDIFNSIETEEPHIVINNDRSITVPDVIKNVAVQYDHDIETVTFDCPRYWDGNDLSGMKIMINFIKPLGDQGAYVCKPATIDQSNDKIIHFDWTISSEVTAQPGAIKFIVCMQKDATDQTTSLIWHSQICSSMNILPGIECDSSVISDYDAGKLAEWSEFWDEFQNNGSRVLYTSAFKTGWNDKIFSPKYDICPTNLEQTFQYTSIINLIDDLEKHNVKLDTSNCTNFYQAFRSSMITHYPTIDMSKAANTAYAFGSGANVVKIEKLILSKSTPFNNTFQSARKLEEITIEGTIGQNGFSVQWSDKLTHDSLLSILNALEDKTSDESGTTWTIGLGPTNIAKITANEKAIATQKGWTIT